MIYIRPLFLLGDISGPLTLLGLIILSVGVTMAGGGVAWLVTGPRLSNAALNIISRIVAIVLALAGCCIILAAILFIKQANATG